MSKINLNSKITDDLLYDRLLRQYEIQIKEKRMKKSILFVSLFLFLLPLFVTAGPINQAYPFAMDYDPDHTILNSIRTPAEYERYPAKKMNIFMAWITNMPLKPANHPVVKWDTQLEMGPDSTSGVIDLGITSKNQRDPDVAIQLVIEFLRVANQLENFPILIGATDTVSYAKWLSGKYASDGRGNLIYKEGETRESNEKEYYRFLEFVMGRINNETLLYNLTPVDEKDVAPGCLYVQHNPDDPDAIGHTAIIFDVAVKKTDESDILLIPGWGGETAHNIYIARPLPVSAAKWFTVDDLKKHLDKYGPGKFYKFSMLK